MVEIRLIDPPNLQVKRHASGNRKGAVTTFGFLKLRFFAFTILLYLSSYDHI